MAISNAVGQERLSPTSGSELKKGNFAKSTSFLSQRVILLGAANTANQSTLDTNPYQLTSASEAGDRYGYGSPMYAMARILFPPLGGDAIGGIPVIAIPQEEDSGATAAERTITVSGTATATVTHHLYINGRNNYDGKILDFTVSKSDTNDTVAAAINTLIGEVLALPITSTVASSVVTATTKFASLLAAGLNIEIETGLNDAGMSYTIGAVSGGTGSEDISDALATFDDDTWNTVVINPYGTATFDTLEAHNGNPDSKTGRYSASVFKPYIAIWGSTLSSKTSLLAITNTSTRKAECTNALCLAPNSTGWAYEAAANGAVLFARNSQDTPELDSIEKAFPDMPLPLDGTIGDLKSYDNRDLMSKAGCSTTFIKDGKFQMQDFITTYNPDSDATKAYRYCRNLNIDWNVKHAHTLRQDAVVKGKALGADNQSYTTQNVIKPKSWIQELNAMFDDLAKKALIVDTDFSKESVEVGISDTNPDRLEDYFRYKRSGYARIKSTTAEAGFQLGNV